MSEVDTISTAPDAADVGDPRVSTFELFFDLVFVFAFTGVTGSLSRDATWDRLGQAVLVFAVLWWAWGSYAWLTNAMATDEVAARLVVLLVMSAMLVVGLAVPDAFGGSGAAFALGYLVVIVLHSVLFAVAGGALRGTLALVPTNGGAALLLVVAGFADGASRTTLWIVAVVLCYAGPYLAGVAEFTVRPSHFVERHGLIVIVALGESVVAIGAGGDHHVDWSLASAGLIAMVLVSGLWWSYFHVESAHAERALREADGIDQSRLARDIYSYLHIPLVLGVVLTAVGIKQTLAARDDPLDAIVAVALGSGVAMYYAALAAIRVRRGARPQITQLALVVVAGLVIPGATRLPAIASLAVLAVAIMIQASIGGATTATGVPDCLSRPAPTAPGRPPRSA
jgi:low temperature requirement protein LtrA